jgi:dihydrofolate reductase
MPIQCSVFIGTSMDGFIARPDGGIDWLTDPDNPSNPEDYGYQAFFNTIDGMVMGRNTYELVLTFPEWPYQGKRVWVITSKNLHVSPELADTVEITTNTPAQLVERLERAGAKRLYIDGGKTIQGFLQAGLIDDMTITRLPVLIGQGIPLFGPLDHDIRFKHLATIAYPNGYVQSQYARLAPKTN